MIVGTSADRTRATAFAETLLSELGHTLRIDDAAESAQPAPADLARAKIGTPDRYRDERVIGEGGMGVVREATDLWFGRRVALKELRVAPAPTSVVRRFMVEALVTANLEHPGIAAVHERGVREGRPYYVMRKLDGRTLGEALEKAAGARERLQYVSTLVRVAQTIAFAHERGVVHRDLKPENIVLGTHGEVTVIDWGIARVRELDHLGLNALSEATTKTSDITHRTVAGSVLGTPAYMAPEQADGRIDEIDERTDVFALGALLYHVLCGRAPFEAPTLALQIAKASTADYPPVETVAPKTPPALVAICARAMAKSPADRFRSANELAAALEEALTNALAGSDSRGVQIFANAATALTLAGALIGAVLAWRVVPPLHVLGSGVFQVIIPAVLAFALCVVEWWTRGRYHLSSLVVAMIGLTFIAGPMTAITGIYHVAHDALAPAILRDAQQWRQTMTEGVYEALGNAMTGLAMTGFLLLLWGVGRRRGLLAERSLR